ncbi:IBR domain protein [Rhizoctonia solani AG-3 Rhs1AP]|uniref:RBR-type E3 ubiquitin transferase n=2 Tax=Rhizoctonia solani AG-3 TaxID=1086053 RepID=A0A074S1U0_9AGAM|nr:IBR domain protein [Rhizoctonia solani AG-3 Rhs1AP]KEP50853.1 IBR domain protein [Rhizoctonia solani 123E]
MNYYANSYGSHNGVSHSLESRPISPYYRQPTPTLATLGGIRFDRHHEPGYNYRPYNCVICLGDDSNSGGLCVPTPRCTHVRSICTGCRTQYLNNVICVQGLTRVSCPQAGCHQQFSEADIERWGDSASKSRYHYLVGIRRTALESLRSVQAASTPRNKRVDEQASVDYMKVHTKPCPSCTAPIAKYGDGCDHMKCAPPGGCGFEFCWLCLCDFEPIRQDGNHRHEAFCKHYRAIEP